MRPFLPQFFSDPGGSGQSRPVDSVLMISQALGERRLPSTRQVTPRQQRAPQKWQLSPKQALLLLSHLPIHPGDEETEARGGSVTLLMIEGHLSANGIPRF